MHPSEDLFAKIKLLIADVDGVMTSGDICITDEGKEIKTFNVQDGFGIRLLLVNKIDFAVITSRSCQAVDLRMKYLGVKHVFQGAKDKLPVFKSLLNDLKIEAHEVAYIGDDWPDLPVLCQVGLPIAVANAVPEVKARALYTTDCVGGAGAVREVVMHILRAKNLYESALANFIYSKEK
ncbi:MAG: kdsC [Gammaproteobacteria bacterium]|jgi:3-deoxy-D-manno-octulosonate 8-phosphate phosphatase (KDO 8-P phosphatase)|nr:kdsC [Gammaproteobacteria bacterium]